MGIDPEITQCIEAIGTLRRHLPGMSFKEMTLEDKWGWMLDGMEKDVLREQERRRA